MFDAGQIWDVIYGFFVTIDSVIYKFIGWLYELYMLISSARIFRTETFEIFINRVYVILGVIMLFFLAYTILKSIADPDSLVKGDSSMGKIISNTVIALVLIAVLPTIFTFLYQAQEILLEENIIGKIILGNYSYSTDTLELAFEADMCEQLNTLKGPHEYVVNGDGTCFIKWNSTGDSASVALAGNSIAVDVFTSFFYPYLTDEEYSEKVDEARLEAEAIGENVDDFTNSNQNYNADFDYSAWAEDNHDFNAKEQYLYDKIASYDACHNMSDGYAYGSTASACAAEMLVYNRSNDIQAPLNFKSVMQYAKTTGDFSGFKFLSNFIYEGQIDYSIILSTIAGLFVCYIMISYCIDMGLRAAKLGFAQLIAPIPILARIVPSQKKMFDSWTKFTLQSYFEVFVRIAIIFLGIFMVTHLPNVQDMWKDSILTKISFMSLKTPLIMDINSASWGTKAIARVAVIIGILMFVKQAPKLISDALGISINTGSLNIRNKLKEMVGGEQVVRGLNAVGSLPAKGFGAVRGALGGMWAAQVQGDGSGRLTRAAALKGLQSGWKTHKGSFRNTYQSVSSDVTGDHKYAHSLFGGNTLGSNINREIDSVYKTNTKKSLENHMEQIKELIKNHDDPSKNRVLRERIQNAQTAYNEAIRNVESSPAFSQAVSNRAQQLRNEYDANEGAAARQRMQAFENSAEYNNLRAIARAEARNDVRQEAANNNEMLSAAEEQKRIDQRLADYILDGIKENSSELARQYKNDHLRERTIDQDLQKQANKEVVNQLKATNENYKMAKESIDAKGDLTGEAFAQVLNDYRADVQSNPRTSEDRAYIKAVAEEKANGDYKSNKELQDFFTKMVEDKKISFGKDKK